MSDRRFPRLPRIPWRPAAPDVDDELRFHIDMATADLVAAGVPPQTARDEAQRRFGSLSDVRAAVLTIDERRRRRAATSDMIDLFINDIRFALRSLRRTPLLTAIVSLTLMLGIGAATTIFSVVNGVLLRPLPYPAPDRLVTMSDNQLPGVTPISWPVYDQWQKLGSPVFETLGTWFQTTLTLTGVGQPVVLNGIRLSSTMPGILGVRPILGRTFLPADDDPTSPRTIMISEECWRRRFNADSAIVGRTLDLSGVPFTVIGVYPTRAASRLPNELSASRHSEYWQPLRLDASRAPASLNFLLIVGRVRRGLDGDRLDAQVRRIGALVKTGSATSHEPKVYDLTTQIIGPTRHILEAIFAAVALVLLVACANVANLLLARAAARQREIAIRTSLGAGRSRIISQLLSESVVRAVLGGGLGIAFTLAVLSVAKRTMTVGIPRFSDVSADWTVLGFAVAISVLTGIAFGLVPALRAADADPNVVMREGGRGVAGSLRRDTVRRALIVSEIVMSFVLLVGAGLLIRSLDRLMSVPKGFNSDHLLTAAILLPSARYPDSTRQAQFWRELLRRTRAVPGVVNAAVVSDLPVQGGTSGGIGIEGRQYDDKNRPVVEKRFASAAFFPTIGARIAKGRDFTDADVMESQHVAIVNEAFATELFPGEDPIGKRIDFLFNTSGLQTIVGVVANVKEQALNARVTPAVYLPEEQRTSSFTYLVVRSSVAQSSLIPAIRRELRAIDANLPLQDTRTLDDVIGDGITNQRLSTRLLSVFSLAALILSAIGLYGVISYSVAQRTQELGIRAALGAQRHEIVRGIMREGMGFVAVGLVVGVVAARGAAQFISAQLFGVTVNDPVVYVTVTLLLVAVGAMALFAPALRAARVDPVIALREE